MVQQAVEKVHQGGRKTKKGCEKRNVERGSKNSRVCKCHIVRTDTINQVTTLFLDLNGLMITLIQRDSLKILQISELLWIDGKEVKKAELRWKRIKDEQVPVSVIKM